MHGNASGYSNAQGTDLAFWAGIIAWNPDARTAVDTPRILKPQVTYHLDDGFLHAAHIIHHVHRLSELDDWIAHQLSGAVPGDPATAIYIHHRQAVDGAILGLRSFASRVGVGVFKEQQLIVDKTVRALRSQLRLPIPHLHIIHRAQVIDL